MEQRNVYDVLLERGLIAQTTHPEEIRELLGKENAALLIVLEFKNPNYYTDSTQTKATEVSIQLTYFKIGEDYIDSTLYEFPYKLNYIEENLVN